MMDAYDDRFKDVCEPESNDDSTTSIVDEFESLLGDIIKQKEELKGISDQELKEGFVFARLDKCKIIAKYQDFFNPLFEKGRLFSLRNDESILRGTLKSYLNPLFEKDEEIISNEASSKISPKVDVKTIVSFFAPIGNCVRKWATREWKKIIEVNHEVLKSDNENMFLGFMNDKEEENCLFLDSLLEDENFFEME
ncbi:hypothetical protein Tco_1185944 [Tanacetum coccineum]